MTIVVNGKETQLTQATTIQQALDEMGYEGTHFAVALNEDFVPRSHYSDTPLNDGDRLEVLSPIRGG